MRSGLAVVAADADVEVIAIGEDPHLGLLGRGLSLVGLLLDEVADRLHRLIGPVVEHAVDAERLIDLRRPHRDAALGVARHHRGRHRRRRPVDDAGRPRPEAVVERLIDLGDAAGDEAATRVVEALAALPAPVEPGGAAAGSFLGDLGDRAARDAFLSRAEELLAGRPGRALVLNLVGSPADVAALLDDARPLAVLAPELAAPLALLRTGATPGKAPPPRVPTRRRCGPWPRS